MRAFQHVASSVRDTVCPSSSFACRIEQIARSDTSISVSQEVQRNKGQGDYVLMASKIILLGAFAVYLSTLCLFTAEARTLMGGSHTSFVRRSHPSPVSAFLARGGAAAVADEELSEIESSDYDEEEEEEETLVKATQKKVSKAAKKAVASGLAASKPKKKKSSGLKLFKLPYILGALFNPFTLIQMTKGYWASLINYEYLKRDEVSDGVISVCFASVSASILLTLCFALSRRILPQIFATLNKQKQKGVEETVCERERER